MQLKDFTDHLIDWNLGPEDAVTLYLEWGNNNWHAEHPPVRSKSDFATYFVIDHWLEKPTLRLVKRNSDEAVDLFSSPLPAHLEKEFKAEFGKLKGVSEPTESIKSWIKQEMYGNIK